MTVALITMPPRVCDPVEVRASTGETITVYTSTGFIAVDVLDTGDVPAQVIGPILSTDQARQIGRVLLTSADEADRMAGKPLSFATPQQLRPRMSWRIVCAQIAMIAAAGALAITGATLVGLAPILAPVTVHLGYAMLASAFLSIVTASLF